MNKGSTLFAASQSFTRLIRWAVSEQGAHPKACVGNPVQYLSYLQACDQYVHLTAEHSLLIFVDEDWCG